MKPQKDEFETANAELIVAGGGLVAEERDLSHGEQMVECFKPFLRHW
jgi:hypothetical protein